MNNQKLEDLINHIVRTKLKGSSYEMANPIRIRKQTGENWDERKMWHYMAPSVQVQEDGGRNNSELYKWK